MTRFINSTTPRAQRQPGDVVVDFVGPSYALSRKKADTQRLINMATQAIESGSGKSPVFLQSIPGLTKFSDPIPRVLFYTSLIYPYLAQDFLNMPVAPIQRALQFVLNPDTMNQPVAALPSGTLVVSISYLSYTNQRDVNPDTMNQVVAPLQPGTLLVTINYLSYTNQRDVNPDIMNQIVAPIPSGTLVVTITFVSYANQRDINPDTMHQVVAPLLSGTLV